jgi:hypothetical protein
VVKMDRSDALDYPMLYEKALAEVERLQEKLWQEAGNRVEVERLREWIGGTLRPEIERLRDALEQAVDDFGDGHCVCEQTKQQCIAAIRGDGE